MSVLDTHQTIRGQNQSNGVPGNTSTLPKGVMPSKPPVYPTFTTGPTLYIPPPIAIQSPNDMVSSPLRQHILNYEPPRGFVMTTFAMLDGSNDPYDHRLHCNHAMTLNANNDHLLCKVFPSSLQGPGLAWFHKLPRNSINPFNELLTAFISQYLCSIWKKDEYYIFENYYKAGGGNHTGLHKEVRASHPTSRGL